MAEERPLNLLFITCDQLRRDAVSAAGLPTLPESSTPALDALAAEGVIFCDHITNSLPCGPSRTALHCGLLAMNHRVVQNGTPLGARQPPPHPWPWRLPHPHPRAQMIGTATGRASSRRWGWTPCCSATPPPRSTRAPSTPTTPCCSSPTLE